MRVVVGQFGGPTPVFNASLHGVLTELHAAGAEVLGIRGGGRGLVAGRLEPLPGPPPDWLLRAPGAALGAGRLRGGEDELRAALRQLAGWRVDAAVLLGGNGTMGLALALAQAGGLRVVGVPKTIDNDLEGTDHAPGFPSAAAFIARATRDLACDLRAMAGFEDVRLVEVMGRHAGWLAGAAVLARAHAGDLPQRVLLPEVPVDVEALGGEVRALHRRDGSVLVIVAEGIRGPGGALLGASALDAGGRAPVLGGAARELGRALREAGGLSVRAESLGFLPRCLAATEFDRSTAREVGRHAARALLGGARGVMAAVRHRPAGGVEYAETPLGDVAGRERLLPPGMRDLGPAFTDWLRPLVEPVPPWPRL